MSRALIVLNSERDRHKASSWVRTAPAGTRVEFKKTKRSIPQNSMMWSLLSDIASHVEWAGLKLRPDDWKTIFIASLKQDVRIVPNLTGNGIVQLGRSSSDLSKDEMSELIEFMIAWGTERGVVFKLLPPIPPERRY